MDCLFCKIANRQLSAEVIYEDDAATGVLDIHPRAPGHTMVLPKVHAANILELPEENMGSIFIAVKNTTALLERSLLPHGFTIGINHGTVSGQTIEHVHIHIIPRFRGDGGGSIHSVVNNPPKESLKTIADKIRSM